jgi:murein DD-endopeptidase MepM/ murein hydrolase activator NlpD
MRFVAFVLVSMSLLFATATTTKIKKSKTALSSTLQEKKKTSRHLDKIAAEIKKAKKELAYIDKRLEQLSRDQNKTEQKYQHLKSELKGYKNDILTTQKMLEQKNKQFLSLLSEQFSTIFAMQQSHEPTKESIITQEIYKAYKAQNEKMLKKIKSDIAKLKKHKQNRIYLQNKTKKELKKIIAKKDEYKIQKEKKKKLLAKLKRDEDTYSAKLAKIEDRQNELRSTLAKLHILREKEVLEAKKRAEARRRALAAEKERQRKLRIARAKARAKAKAAALALKKAKDAKARAKAKAAAKAAKKEEQKIAKESKRKVNLNASYQKEKIYAYRGGKTISPLPGAKLVRKFGTYIDPLYNMKIFNDNVILKAPKRNAKVHNVLNGKVVYAGNSSMLGKVVVIAHSGKMHTIYAGLSQIAPDIKVGRKLKRGYVVGRVKSKLVFEATKNSKHINPLKLIKL